MSVMLTLLPLAMIGATVWWCARIATRADMEREAGDATRVDRADLAPVGGAETIVGAAFRRPRAG
jgi:hypothetical protein